MSVFKFLVFSSTLAASASVGALSMTQATPSATCSGSYLIAKGDTLLDIAHDQLGTVFAVQKLIDVNMRVVGPDPDLIFAGDTLSIPCESVVAQPIDWSVMPDAQTLAGLLRQDHVQVLDIRSHDHADHGVIPGSIHVPFDMWQDPEAADLRPTEALMSDIVGLSGLRLDRPIIIVNNKPSVADLGQSTAVYDLLQAVGAEHLAILRDGYRSWINADLPVVAFPALKDPYDIVLSYAGDTHSGQIDMLDIVSHEAPSTFWQEVAPKPAHLDARQGGSPFLLLAHFIGG